MRKRSSRSRRTPGLSGTTNWDVDICRTWFDAARTDHFGGIDLRLYVCDCRAAFTGAFLLWRGTSSILDMTPPISGLALADLRDTFEEIHNGHRHEAIDILEPRGTPVHAVVSGTIRKLFLSKPGGNTIYEFDEMRNVLLLLRAPGPVRGRVAGGNADRAWGDHRFCGIDGKCGCAHAALAFCNLRVGAGKAVVERDSH
jgi:hypothetical protein